jgi:hypothetical protein
MSLLGKILGFVLMRRNMSSVTPLFNHLLTGLAVIIGLSIIIAIMVGILLTGGLYVFYESLIMNGLAVDLARGVIGLMVLFIIIILMVIVYSSVKKIKFIPRQIMDTQNPVSARASAVWSSFMDGLLTHSVRHKD